MLIAWMGTVWRNSYKNAHGVYFKAGAFERIFNVSLFSYLQELS